jgi:hypothetical protein
MVFPLRGERVAAMCRRVRGFSTLRSQRDIHFRARAVGSTLPCASLPICGCLCYPQLYIAYRKKGATLIIHSFSNARSKGPNLLDTLDVRMVPTRGADNRLWAICNNSSAAYSHWGLFVARPDATIAKQLGINEPGMFIHDFPGTLSPGGWYITDKPMEVAENEITYWGKPSNSPRQSDVQSAP